MQDVKYKTAKFILGVVVLFVSFVIAGPPLHVKEIKTISGIFMWWMPLTIGGGLVWLILMNDDDNLPPNGEGHA